MPVASRPCLTRDIARREPGSRAADTYRDSGLGTQDSGLLVHVLSLLELFDPGLQRLLASLGRVGFHVVGRLRVRERDQGIEVLLTGEGDAGCSLGPFQRVLWIFVLQRVSRGGIPVLPAEARRVVQLVANCVQINGSDIIY